MIAWSKKQRSTTRLASALAVALVLTACGGGDEEPADTGDELADAGEEDAGEEDAGEEDAGEDAEGGGDDAGTVSVLMTVDASAVPAFVAQDRGFFEGVDVEVSEVGYDQVDRMLVTADTEVAWFSPLEAAAFASEGEDFRYFTTAGAQNMWNGVVVSADAADQYDSINDLEGLRLGIPGFATGTWASFEAFTRAYYGIDDPASAFDVVTADSGALLALVENGEVDAALLFSGASAAARSLPEFHTVFSFTEAMQEETGQPLVVTGAVATGAWLDENPAAAAQVEAGLDEAVAWMQDNTEAFDVGGEYEGLAEAAGWLSGPETTATVLDLISQGEWVMTSENYSEEWIDAIFQLLEAGEGSLVESVPERDAAFQVPGSLADAL